MTQNTDNFVKAMLDRAKEKEEAKPQTSTDVDVQKIESITDNIRSRIQQRPRG